MGGEQGLRIYNLDYFLRLLPVKFEEYGIGLPWLLIGSQIEPVARRIYEDDHFIAWAMDEHNRAACQSAFMMGHGLELGIGATCIKESDEWELKFTPSPSQFVRVLTPKAVRTYFLGTKMIPENHQQQLFSALDKLYADHLFFVRLSKENRLALDAFFSENPEEDDRVDVRVRLK